MPSNAHVSHLGTSTLKDIVYSTKEYHATWSESTGRVTAKKMNKEIGYISYFYQNNGIYIENIVVLPEFQRLGIAKTMIFNLVKIHPYETIDWGAITPDGARLKKYMDKIYL